MNNLVCAAIIGIGVIHGTGNGHLFRELFTFLGQHSAPLGQIAIGVSVAALFVAWVAHEGGRIRLEDEAINKGER